MKKEKKAESENMKRQGFQVDLYDGKVHDDSVKQILSNGGFPEEFCKLWNITLRTFNRWQQRNPSFKESVKSGKLYGQAVWLKKPLDRQENAFSHQYWHMILKNIYHWGAIKIPELKEPKSPKEIIDITISLLAKGRIPERIADKLNMLAMSKLRIIELTELENRITQLEQLASLGK